MPITDILITYAHAILREGMLSSLTYRTLLLYLAPDLKFVLCDDPEIVEHLTAEGFPFVG